MGEYEATILGRRGFLATAAAAGLLALPRSVQAVAVSGSQDPGYAVRQLLKLSSRKAFAAVSQPDGFWDSTVARINLPTLFSKTGAPPRRASASAPSRGQLQHKLNNVAERGASRASVAVERGIARLTILDPAAVLHGPPTTATTLLRGAMGAGLVNAMIPPLNRALRSAKDPVIAQAMAGLKGVGYGDVAHALANETDNAIWYAIGAAEAEIRRDPQGSGDAALSAALLPA